LIAIGKAEQRVEKALTELRAAGRKEWGRNYCCIEREIAPSSPAQRQVTVA
jgi:hypothetical protein